MKICVRWWVWGKQPKVMESPSEIHKTTKKKKISRVIVVSFSFSFSVRYTVHIYERDDLRVGKEVGRREEEEAGDTIIAT
jgi:hypothetical protein